MRCSACGHINPPDSNFCLACGARLNPSCPACGTVLPAGSRFCNRCGTPVSGSAPTQAPDAGPVGPARFTAPDTYTPKHLAERIVTSRAGLEGERKQVTVL